MKRRRVSVGVLIAVFTLGSVVLCSAQVTETAVGKKYVGTWVPTNGVKASIVITRVETGYEVVETVVPKGTLYGGQPEQSGPFPAYVKGGVLIIESGSLDFGILKDDQTLVLDGGEWKRQPTAQGQ